VIILEALTHASLLGTPIGSVSLSHSLSLFLSPSLSLPLSPSLPLSLSPSRSLFPLSPLSLFPPVSFPSLFPLLVRSYRFAVSYSLGQSAPLMAVVWGLVWREFAGAPRMSYAFLGLTFLLYGAAIAFVALSGSDDIHVCRPVPNGTDNVTATSHHHDGVEWVL
jgi:hypothetical protein